MSHDYGPHSSGAGGSLLDNSQAYQAFIERLTQYAVSLVAAERERCAKIADARAAFWGKNGEEIAAASGREIAARIRRGE